MEHPAVRSAEGAISTMDVKTRRTVLHLDELEISSSRASTIVVKL